MRASILIVHPDRKTQRTIQRILGVTGHSIEVADDFEQGTRMLANLAPSLVVVDGSAIGDAAAFFAYAHARGAEACMTLLGAAASEALPRILEATAITNLLVHPMPVLGEELVITAQKLLRGELFGVEKYLLWGTTLETHTLTHASQRADLTSMLGEHLKARGQSARVASMARLVADELISNAVHNAPVNADGEHYRRDTPRDIELALDGRHEVRLRWGCDARYVAIEVTDHFGSLDRATILHALAKSEVRESGGGAGMGISLAYRSCDHLVFNLAPGRTTEIIALVDIRYPPSERMSASSYNVFVEKP
ncbi:MAG: hypothetical protein NT062_03720 [Proteobacteria bacterium]|nr:hypothetical protein [Pseudomonadota bacterium]